MTQQPDPNDRPEEAKLPPAKVPARVIDAAELFQGGREVWLDHDGVRYRLRITRRNNLLLEVASEPPA